MLTHSNLVTNVYQSLTKGETSALTADDVLLDFLPLYHIYGLTICLNMMLSLGATLVLMPRFDVTCALRLMVQEGITNIPCVPAVINAFCAAAEQGHFPAQHRVRWV